LYHYQLHTSIIYRYLLPCAGAAAAPPPAPVRIARRATVAARDIERSNSANVTGRVDRTKAPSPRR